MYHCRAEDARIAVLVTYDDGILLTGDYEEEMQGKVNHLLKRYEGRDLGGLDKLIGVALMVTDKGTKLDQAPYTITEEMGLFDLRKVSTPLNPGMDLSPRQENEQELHRSSCSYTRSLGSSCSWRERQDLLWPATSPCMRHWRGLQHVFRYISRTLDVSINCK